MFKLANIMRGDNVHTLPQTTSMLQPFFGMMTSYFVMVVWPSVVVDVLELLLNSQAMTEGR
jgi:hypothetical protein